MRDGVGDRTFPLEADIAVAGLHRQARHDHAAHARSVKIELGIAEPIGEKLPARHHFGAHHVAVESIGALPVGDVDDAMVKFDRKGHWGSSSSLQPHQSAALAIPTSLLLSFALVVKLLAAAE